MPDDALPDRDAPGRLTDDERERAMRDAEARALGESGLGSGLLAQQSGEHAGDVAVPKVCPQCSTEYETAARFCPADGTALRPKGSDSVVGRVLADRYHILKRIGEGGMGRVYLGEHVKMGRQCAVKVMNPALVNDSESASRFAREASNASRIIHPNVAAVFDYGESDGVVYLVMEYVDGEPLSRIITREAPIPIERALDIGRQIAEGLEAAHELGIVHRDLKPDNILVAPRSAGRESAKVVDFGIAKAVQETAGDALTRTGLVIGTPEFMSPEQLLGDPIDARSDLYALGCILYLMLTGRPAFAAPTREQMIKRRLSEAPPRLQTVDAGLPDSLDTVVARLLAKDPADRYDSAADVIAVLSGEHERSADSPLPAPPGRLTPRSLPTITMDAADATTVVTAAVPTIRRPSRVQLFVGTGVLVAAGALVMLLLPPRASRAPVAVPADSAALRPVVDGDLVLTAPLVPMVDSAKLAADQAKQRVQDSVARVARASEDGVRNAVLRYRRAVDARDLAAVKAAVPSLSEQQGNYWRGVFKDAERVASSIRNWNVKVKGERADVDFSMAVQVTTKGSREPSYLSLPQQHATLERSGGVWRIVALR